jgi:hypothetical protein
MPPNELADLAEDIRANGLIHPIVVDGDGILIDGRNRLRACELAGVEPTFRSINGADAAAFIASANSSPSTTGFVRRPGRGPKRRSSISGKAMKSVLRFVAGAPARPGSRLRRPALRLRRGSSRKLAGAAPNHGKRVTALAPMRLNFRCR